MFPSRTKTILLSVVVFGLAMIGVRPATGQRNRVPPMIGIPEDWSHHHVVFSQPRTAEEAVRVQQEPRYWHQWFRRSVLRQLPAQPVSGPAYVSTEDFPPITLPELKRRGTRGARSVSLQGLWEKRMGPSATSTGTPAVYPAKFQFLTVANTAIADCSKDFIVFPTGVAGATTTVASIVAYNNIYTGCGGTVPSTAWAVNLNAGTVVTSPVLSQDGTQVAFVATFGGVANLVVLTWKNAAGIAQITASSATVNNGCATPCAAWVSLGTTDGVAVTGGFVGSSPFYDYTNNIVYVGDHAGKLHKVINVFAHFGFNNTANTTAPSIDPGGSGFPATVSTAQLTSPIYDSTGGRIWVADQTGFISAVLASTGVVVKSTNQYAHGDFFTDGPLIDSSAEFGYFFSPKDENDCGPSPYCAAVIQVNLATAGFPTTKLESGFANIGVDTTASNDTPVYVGAFDSKYYAGSGGNLYACGDPYGVPTLYQIPISVTNTIGTVTAGPKPSSTVQATCSPIAEVLNAGTDFLFVGVTGTGADTGCATAGGCVFSYNVTGPITAANFAAPLKATAGLAVAGGTSGIVIDNTFPTSSIPTNGASAGGTSQVYFSNLASQTCTTDAAAGGCAIQASQAAFQ